ncbi:MAG: type IV pilus inner membrane component PilO [Planctomycetota bacterium]|jgi:Tfp pilus assembly protein PilO
MKFGMRELIFVVLLLSLPLGAWWFIFHPQNARNSEMLKEIKAKQEKLRALNQVTATIGDLDREISSHEDSLKKLQKQLPKEEEIDKVLKEIWDLAEANHLKTKTVRTLTRKPGISPAGEDGPRERPIAVQLEGNFKGFYTFLQALERQPRIMRIHKLTLTTDEKKNTGHVQASFEMCVFFKKEGKDEECL